jgi:hypothetical protein
MSKEIEMTQTIQDLKLISESTHDKEVRNSVNIIINHILRTEQGWVDEDFEIKKSCYPLMNQEKVKLKDFRKSEVKRFQEYAKRFHDWYWSDKNKVNQNKDERN